MGDDICDLECIKKLPPEPKIHEFVGTVKILLIDTPAAEYCWKRIESGLITLVYIMMGANVMHILFYTLTFKLGFYMNLHILLCTLGYQLFIPCGMMIMNSLNVSSNVMKVRDRKIQHLVLQIFGLVLCSGGTAIAILSPKFDFTHHTVFGMVAGGFAVFAMLLGPLNFFNKGHCMVYYRRVHMFFAVVSLIAGSLSFITGINRYCIYRWLPAKHMQHFFNIFCFLYTAIIVKIVLMSMLKKYGD